MPLRIREYIREKKANVQEAQIKRANVELAGKSAEARRAKRYSNTIKLTEKLDKEISTAKAYSKKHSKIAKFKGAVSDAKKNYSAFKEKKEKMQKRRAESMTLSEKGNTGFGGNAF